MVIFKRTFSLIGLWKVRFFVGVMMKRLLQPVVFFNVCRLWWNTARKKKSITHFPFYLMIEPSSRCNIVCKNCKRTLYGLNRKECDLSLAQYMRIIDQCGERLLFLVLWNYGEPLLNCEIAKMISYGSDNGIPTVMSTNGTLLTDDTIRDLITSKLSYLIVSISSSSYGDQIWNIVRERIERFLRLRQMLRAHLPIIDVQLVTDSDDRKTNNAMLQSLSVPGVDRYTLKRASRLRNKEADVTPSSEAKKFCPVPWHTLVVNADGRVVPCCMDFFSTVVYGDVTKNSLVDIWNSKKAQSFREEIVKNINNMQVCQACPHADGHVGTFIRQ